MTEFGTLILGHNFNWGQFFFHFTSEGQDNNKCNVVVFAEHGSFLIRNNILYSLAKNCSLFFFFSFLKYYYYFC